MAIALGERRRLEDEVRHRRLAEREPGRGLLALPAAREWGHVQSGTVPPLCYQPGMDYDAIIAGAGPVGLFLACELRLAKRSVLVLEQLADPRSPLKGMP